MDIVIKDSEIKVDKASSRVTVKSEAFKRVMKEQKVDTDAVKHYEDVRENFIAAATEKAGTAAIDNMAESGDELSRIRIALYGRSNVEVSLSRSREVPVSPPRKGEKVDKKVVYGSTTIRTTNTWGKSSGPIEDSRSMLRRYAEETFNK